jgi:hypothetical protein
MWIQIVLGLIGLASAITSWLRDRKALNQAGADVVSQQLKAALNEIQTADKIRDAVLKLPRLNFTLPFAKSRSLFLFLGFSTRRKQSNR